MKSYSSLLFLFFLLPACQEKDIEFELTPATQSGANTLSFKVDGRVWQPYGKRCVGYGFCVDEPLKVYYTPKGPGFQLVAFMTTRDRAENFQLNYSSTRNTRIGRNLYFAQARVPGDPSYSTVDSTRTTITITRFDTVAHVLSGTFQGFLQGSKSLTTTITEGRFDVKY